MERSYLLVLAFAAAFVIGAGHEVKGQNYTYEIKYHEVALDHFSFASNKTFQMRYLVNANYSSETGPILFYVRLRDFLKIIVLKNSLLLEKSLNIFLLSF